MESECAKQVAFGVNFSGAIVVRAATAEEAKEKAIVRFEALTPPVLTAVRGREIRYYCSSVCRAAAGGR